MNGMALSSASCIQARHRAKPSIFGISTSETMASGGSRRAAASASRPSPAAVTR